MITESNYSDDSSIDVLRENFKAFDLNFELWNDNIAHINYKISESEESISSCSLFISFSDINKIMSLQEEYNLCLSEEVLKSNFEN